MQGKDKKKRKGEDTTILTHFCVLRIYLCYYSGVSTGHAPSDNEVLDHFGGSRKKKVFSYFKTRKTARTIYLQHTVHHLPVF